MKKVDLLGNDGDEDDFSDLKVNQAYAKRFEHNKKREDLHRLKELGRELDLPDSEDDDEDSEEEDEEGKLPFSVEAKIFDTLAKIKKKDPLIYESDVNFFDENEAETENGHPRKEEKKGSQKKIYLKDVALTNAIADVEGEDNTNRAKAKTYVHEQEEIRKEFLKAAELQSPTEEEDDLLTVRTAANSGQKGVEPEIEEVAKQYFDGDDSLNEGDRFLKNFLLNQGWLDENKDRAAPQFESMVDEIDEDEEAIEKQEEFEKRYNFRFEEGASSQVEGHGRKIEGSVRKKSEKRKETRQSRAAKKEELETGMAEEVKRLKNVKKSEIEDRLRKVKEVAGEVSGIESRDLEGDFDPDKYDEMMRSLFSEEYYNEEDGEMERILSEREEKGAEALLEEELGAEEGPAAVAGFKALREKTAEEKDEEKLKLAKLVEEYYKLDYEDMVGGLATRFRYREVKPNRYGLSTEEILKLEDRELNQIVSVKKLAPYRGEEWEVRHSVAPASLAAPREGAAEGRRKKREAHAGQRREVPAALVADQSLSKSGRKNLKRKLKRMSAKGEKVESIQVSRLQSYGVEGVGAGGQQAPKKAKKKLA